MFFIYALFFVTNIIFCMDVDLSKYKLDPKSSLFKQLSSLNLGENINNLEDDASWYDLRSVHWLVGSVKTAGQTQYVVKGQNHTPGDVIYLSEWPPVIQIHTDTQNLSRISQKEKIDAAIKELGLDQLRTVKTWVFPLSGNNEDLNKKDLKDRDILIVEEYVKKKSQEIAYLPNTMIKVQKDCLQISNKLFEQLKKLVLHLKLPDQSPNNFCIDESGKLVLFDVEDILSYQRECNSKKSCLIRPYYNYKLKCLQEGGAALGLMITAQVNEDSEVNDQKLGFACSFLYKTFLKRNLPEISILSGAVGAAIRHSRYVKAVNKLTKVCSEKINKTCSNKPTLLEDHALLYQEVKEIVNSFDSSETREEIFNAFATIAIAQFSYQTGPIEVYGTTYQSKTVAIESSIKKIKSVWCSDRSLRSKCYRLIKGGIRSVGHLVCGNQTESKPADVCLAG